METKRLKITAKLKKFDATVEETEIFFAILTEQDDIDICVQMVYGCWYQIISYTTEPVDIFVSENYCKEIAIKLLNKK